MATIKRHPLAPLRTIEDIWALEGGGHGPAWTSDSQEAFMAPYDGDADSDLAGLAQVADGNSTLLFIDDQLVRPWAASSPVFPSSEYPATPGEPALL